MNRRRTYQIALAGICTALILLFLWLSVIIRFGKISLYIVCCCVLMVPLTKKYYLASIFAYIASSLLAFVVVGDVFSILGFIGYFAPMTIISAAMKERNIKLYVSLPIKIIFMNAVLAIFYFVTGTIFLDYGALGLNVHYAVIAIVGTLILVVLDFVLLYIYDFISARTKNILRD